ncbi:tetraketide alpha-pyrone reductase 1 isoform X3 [Selaginella moellendorffii]|uniref:tetraketide alpha-pyrone reductase 1 isoform X3 n=1 Tax=Selaginella moellendorffii TaxID=88036 RepID=UPI000D1C8FE6|nr:tetraketide alpha-pyrone reductase 1 isoform X3 [Selaginella moellendorffii]|eukprot:XP_024532704.1 tetraketide alpha-pyrone reductase 1 isoform X3 [Selaginella moellendorffii]
MDSEKVCVTGASGFLASWLVKRLLEEGYYVVGTVRDPDDASKTAHLWELPGARERLDLKKADLITPGAFDDIVQGCHGVFHIAAAVTNRYKEDPLTEIVDPCVLGTLNVLNACKRSTTVKRVVCTSSVAAVSARNDFKPDDVLDESVWSAPDFCREIEMWYGLGKTLPEQAALEFGKENGIEEPRTVSIRLDTFISTTLLKSSTSSPPRRDRGRHISRDSTPQSFRTILGSNSSRWSKCLRIALTASNAKAS